MWKIGNNILGDLSKIISKELLQKTEVTFNWCKKEMILRESKWALFSDSMIIENPEVTIEKVLELIIE